MTYLWNMLVALLFVSCSSNDESFDAGLLNQNMDESSLLKSETTKEEGNALFELVLHHRYLGIELAHLNARKDSLVAEIENGNEEALAELEQVQQTIGLNQMYLEYTESKFRPIKIKRPPKPLPCSSPLKNCLLPLVSEQNIVALSQQDELKIKLVHQNGEVVGEVTELTEDPENNLLYYFLESHETGELLLQVTKFFEPAETMITYTLDVVVE